MISTKVRSSLTIVLVVFGAWSWLSSDLVSHLPTMSPTSRTVALGLPLTNGPGTIRGTVRIESKIRPRSLAFNLYSRQGLNRHKENTPRTPELENVVLYLESGSQRLQSRPSVGRTIQTIEQVNETFVPHVLPVTVGTTVHFPNGDPFFHNVFSLSSAKNFDLGRYPQGQIRSVKFERPGIVKVFCHIHSHMSAVILVFDHPYFSVPDASGNFFIEGISPGNYQLVAWHERLKPSRQPVAVTPAGTLEVDIVL